jgi:hypothetical protein
MNIRLVFFSAILLPLVVSAVSLRSSSAESGGKGWSNLPPEAQSSILTELEKSEGFKGLAQQAKLTRMGGKDGDGFGNSVAVSGDTIVVGVPFLGNRGQGPGKGAVYVFVKPKNGWKTTSHATAKLTANDGMNCTWVNCLLGLSVAIDDDTIMAGSYAAVSGSNSTGAVYVYVKPVRGWKTTSKFDAKLIGPDNGSHENFGFPVALSGDVAVSGSSQVGPTYLIVKPRTGWKGQISYTATLSPSMDQGITDFGIASAISGNTVVVGAPEYPNGNAQGAAYVYVKPAGGWQDMTETAMLTASDGAAFAEFGVGVAVRGGTVAIGASHAISGGTRTGTAYVFIQPKNGWKDMTETAELTPSDSGQFEEHFGQSAAVGTGKVVVGAEFGGPSGQGSAYVFQKPVGGWKNASEPATFTSSDGVGGDEFSYSLAIEGNTIVAGAPFAPFDSKDGFAGPGAAYVFGK